jgi:DNA-binding response OmpR family regulator
VVLADDDDELRQTLAEYLATCGFRVLQATNGLEALLHVKRERPAAVILDIHMPRLGGLDAVARIRAFDPSMIIAIITGD